MFSSLLIWDLAIVAILLLTSLTAYKILRKNSQLRKLQNYLFGAFFIVIGLVVFYGSFIESQIITPKVTTINYSSDKKAELRIVQLTDLHVGLYKNEKYITSLAQKIRQINPDLILMTGDYILEKETNAEALRPLSLVTTKIPTYATSGNHEYSLGWETAMEDGHYRDKTTTLRQVFSDIQVNFIENDVVNLEIKGQKISLVGLREIWTQYPELNTVLEELNKQTETNSYKILLSHNPDVTLTPNSSLFNLILSGHTHGGQIRLPYIGAVPPLPDRLGHHYDRGLFSLSSNNYLYISEGLGEAGPRARLFCPPELTTLEINF
jgi:hypothetical protein